MVCECIRRLLVGQSTGPHLAEPAGSAVAHLPDRRAVEAGIRVTTELPPTLAVGLEQQSRREFDDGAGACRLPLDRSAQQHAEFSSSTSMSSGRTKPRRLGPAVSARRGTVGGRVSAGSSRTCWPGRTSSRRGRPARPPAADGPLRRELQIDQPHGDIRAGRPAGTAPVRRRRRAARRDSARSPAGSCHSPAAWDRARDSRSSSTPARRHRGRRPARDSAPKPDRADRRIGQIGAVVVPHPVVPDVVPESLLPQGSVLAADVDVGDLRRTRHRGRAAGEPAGRRTEVVPGEAGEFGGDRRDEDLLVDRDEGLSGCRRGRSRPDRSRPPRAADYAVPTPPRRSPVARSGRRRAWT